MKIENNYRETLVKLRELTDNWSADSGVVPCADYGSCQIVEEILNKHYRKVEVKDLKEDNEYDLQYHVVYSQPSNIEENVNLKTKKYKQLDFIKNYSPDSSAINKQCDSDVASGSFGESIEKHDSLNDKIFGEDNQLKPEVKEKLLDIAKRFMDNLQEDGIEIKADDIRIVGSNASYNYTDQSDIDLHIIADLSIYKDNEDLAEKLYDAYRRLFNDKYDPTIYGHEVEVYVEPGEESNETDYTGEIAESGTFDKFKMGEDMNTENIVASYIDGELIDLYKAYHVDGLRTKNNLSDFVKQSKIYKEANGPMREAGFVFEDEDIMRTGVYWYNRDDDDTYVQIAPPEILIDDVGEGYRDWQVYCSAIINNREEDDYIDFKTCEKAISFAQKFIADPRRYFKEVYSLGEDVENNGGTWDISWNNGVKETTYNFDNRVEADDYYNELLALQNKPSMRGLVIKKSGKYNEE